MGRLARLDYGWIVVATLCVTETVSWVSSLTTASR